MSVPPRGRCAAVDYGRRRIGLAVSDPLGITARGLPTLERGPDLCLAAREVARILVEAGVAHVVVGLPLHDDGRESEMSKEARAFGEALRAASGLSVEWFDEGLTSWEAEETLKKRKKPLREARRAGEVDREAARAILLSWLREHPLPPQPR